MGVVGHSAIARYPGPVFNDQTDTPAAPHANAATAATTSKP
jgi:hypothetical protein